MRIRAATSLLAILVTTMAIYLLPTISLGQVIASSGFNDASGINSNATPNSPYTIGQTVDGRGTGEPGWSNTWTVQQGGASGGGEHALILAAAAHEGDGGLQLEPNPTFGTTRAFRGFATAQSRSFRIDVDINFVAAGEVYSRPGQGGAPEGIGTGPEWRLTGNTGSRHFEVADGTGDQIEHWENTGIAQLPGQWQHIGLDVNVATQTWTFSVDGVPYNSPDPLGFTGQPASIGFLEYLSTSSGYVDAVVVSAVPEPTSAMIYFVLAVSALRRQKKNFDRG